MMPYVTEELWQRLPGRGTLGASEPKTIMLAPYPAGDASFANAKVEEGMKVVMSAVSACRAMRQTYNIANKDRPNFYAKCGPDRAAVLTAQRSDVETLGKGNLKINEDAPKASAVSVLDDDLTIYMDLAGMVDPAKEVRRSRGRGARSEQFEERKTRAGREERKTRAGREERSDEDCDGREERSDKALRILCVCLLGSSFRSYSLRIPRIVLTP